MSAPRTHRLLQNQHDATPFVGASGKIVCKATRVEGRARSHICPFHVIALEWINVAKGTGSNLRRLRSTRSTRTARRARHECPGHAPPSAEPARCDAIRRGERQCRLQSHARRGKSAITHLPFSCHRAPYRQSPSESGPFRAVASHAPLAELGSTAAEACAHRLCGTRSVCRTRGHSSACGEIECNGTGLDERAT
jgi:hypothetical protein